MSMSVVVCLLLFVCKVDSQRFGNDDVTIDLDLINHQPCHYQPGVSRWTRKIEFQRGGNNGGAQLIPRPGYPGCYTVGGRVTVYEDITSELSVYVEVRNKGRRDTVPYRCVNAGDNGCDRGLGSCLYCDPCRSVEQKYTGRAQLLVDGQPMRCSDQLRTGVYTNVQLSFCAPQLNEIINSQGLSKQTFLSLLQTEDGNSLRSIGMFANIYLFDKNVSGAMATQRRIEKAYRSKERIFFKDENLPASVYWSMPFNRMIQEQRQFIACHNINANIRVYYNR